MKIKRKRKRNRKKTQFPNQYFKFRCGHDGILPESGLSNHISKWNGKYWQCMECLRKTHIDCRLGVGEKGLIGRMRHLISSAKSHARVHGYKPLNITPENLVSAWEKQQGRCAWTNKPLELTKAHLDHNHETGEFRGFVTHNANTAEGHLSKMTFDERVLFLKILYSEEIREAFLS